MMDDGFYFIRHGSYVEHGPFISLTLAIDEGIEYCDWSRDFIVQEWRGGNTVNEWRDFADILD